MTDITINAQVLQFNQLTEKQQKKLIESFMESQAECWQGFYDFTYDIEYIFKEYPEYLKIFEFCESDTRYNISFSQGDYANIGITSINLKEWLKTLKNSNTYSKIAKSLLRCDNAFNQINDNIEFKSIKESFSYNINIEEYYIDGKYCDKYRELIDCFEADIRESIETMNRLVYRYLRDSYLSCFDSEYAKQELSQVNYTVFNGIIVSQD